MSLKESSEMPLPPFVDIGTLRDMSDVAAKIALIRRYVGEVKKIEYKLLREGADGKRFDLAMSETAKFAKICADKADEAIGVLEGIRQGIHVYLRRIQNVPD